MLIIYVCLHNWDALISGGTGSGEPVQVSLSTENYAGQENLHTTRRHKDVVSVAFWVSKEFDARELFFVSNIDWRQENISCSPWFRRVLHCLTVAWQ